MTKKKNSKIQPVKKEAYLKINPEAKFDDILKSLKNEEIGILYELDELMEYEIGDSETDCFFTIEGQVTNIYTDTDEHFWYQWDVGTTKTGVLLDNINKAIYVVSFEIIESWHRQRVLVNPGAIFSAKEITGGLSEINVLILDDFDEVELSGIWFDPAEAILENGAPYQIENYENLHTGLNIMNLTAFQWGPNIVCRF